MPSVAFTGILLHGGDLLLDVLRRVVLAYHIGGYISDGKPSYDLFVWYRLGNTGAVGGIVRVTKSVVVAVRNNTVSLFSLRNISIKLITTAIEHGGIVFCILRSTLYGGN